MRSRGKLESASRISLSVFIEHNGLAAIILSKGEFLQEVGQHVVASNIESVVGIGEQGADGEDLGALIFDGDLAVLVGVFAGKEGSEGGFDLDEESARVYGGFIWGN